MLGFPQEFVEAYPILGTEHLQLAQKSAAGYRQPRLVALSKCRDVGIKPVNHKNKNYKESMLPKAAQ